MPTPPGRASDGIAQAADLGRQARPAHEGPTGDSAAMLMEQVVRRENLLAAYERVRANKGAPGVDGMTVDELADFCREHWPRVREQLLGGTYVPQPVRKVEIPKPGGKGVRTLGIPTALDRLIQQALLQQLTPIFDPLFSDYNYGFRPGRSAHQAIETARDHVAARSRRWCRTSCSTNSTANWNGEAIASCVMPTMRTFMCAVIVQAVY